MDNKHRVEIDQLSQHYRTSFQPSVEGGLRRLHARIEAAEQPRHNRRSWLSIAAAITLLAVAAFGLRAWVSSNSPLYATTDSTKEVILPDGTTVVLNHHTDLNIAEDFNETERRIVLNGEGFFEVAPDKDRPFILQQGDLELRVVGTAFNLDADAATGSLLVEVSEGKVRLSTAEESIEIGPQQCGMRADEDAPLDLVPAPHLNRHAWRTGQLSFERTPLSKALTAIAASYRINWEISESFLDNCGALPLTARFDQDPVEDVLATLAIQFALEIEQKGESRTYRLSGNCDS